MNRDADVNGKERLLFVVSGSHVNVDQLSLDIFLVETSKYSQHCWGNYASVDLYCHFLFISDNYYQIDRRTITFLIDN
jgi:hypothetical protein